MNEPMTAREEWRRYWATVLAAMVGMSFYTVITYSLGTFIGPLEKEFGWSRTALSSGLTIFAGISMLGGPFVGMAVDRFGTRKLAIAGMVLSGLSFAAFSLLSGSMMQWIALYVVYGVFALAIKSTVWSAGISSIFTSARSLALAVVLSGSAIGQTLAPVIANKLIAAFGWREAYFWLGLGWAGLALVLLVPFYFDAHARKARQPPAAGAAPAAVLPGLTIREATRDSRVIRIAVANLVMSIVGSGVSVHLVRIVAEKGIEMDRAVDIAATAGLAGLAGKLGCGWLLDRVQGSVIPFSGFVTGAAGYFLLIGLFTGALPLTLGAMCVGFASGAGLQISTYLISRYAGLRNFGAIFGTISSTMMAGTAAGPLIAGSVHDLTGSYDALLMTAAPVMLLCALLFIGLGPYPQFKTAGQDRGNE
ncbi:MFS transporter [Novosphingobium album (ex Hu et al. 2023)]|uniref:MFS transporter n=1 Tax=Novosphingobium album (ex Hu et al. 2023) TaxID=2930093 RepID=A0ABT0AX69_9SPHN|nr:MFS transporter [Novosphingobium album (ex Hu et al. 2023)]MCJ2177400.1 MFS transporter [Novosphingobium album (ex Hu et al. 2023)]